MLTIVVESTVINKIEIKWLILDLNYQICGNHNLSKLELNENNLIPIVWGFLY